MNNDVSILIKAVDQASNVINKVKTSLTGLTKSATDTEKATGSVATQMFKGMAGFEVFKQGITMLSGALTGTAQVALSFEKSMNNVKAVAGATEQEFKKLREQAMQLGDETIFSSSQVADAQFFLASAGYKTQQVLQALPGILDMASAGQIDLARASDIATNAMGQFGLSAEESNRVSNLFAATAAESKTDILMIDEAMKYLGPTAKSLGMDIEHTAGIIGVLGNSGLQGSMAGRALGTALVNLNKPTKETSQAIRNLNLNTVDSQGKFVGMTSLLKQLENGTKKMTQSQRNQNLSMLLGNDAFQEISILLEKGSEGYENFTKSITGTTKAQEMAKIQQEGLPGAWASLSSAIEGAQIRLMSTEVSGKKLIDWVAIATLKITDFIRSMDFQKAVDSLRNLEPVLFAIAGVILTAVVPAIVSMVTAMTPFILLGTAIGALLYTMKIAFETNFLGIRDIVLITFEAIKNIFQSTFSILQNIITFWINIFTGNWAGAWENIKAIVSNFFIIIINILNLGWEIVKLSFQATWTVIKNILSLAIDSLVFVIKTFVDTIVSIFAVFYLLFTGQWSEAWNKIKDVSSGIWESISTNLSEKLTNMWNWMKTTGKEMITNAGKDMWQGLLDSLGAVWEGIKNKVAEIANSAKTAFLSITGGNTTNSSSPRTSSRGKQFGGFVDKPKNFAFGGLVEGMTGIDKVPAMLSAGEVVLNASQQRNVAQNLQGNTGKSVVINIGGNFYGNDKEFANKIGDQIMKEFVKHTAFESF